MEKSIIIGVDTGNRCMKTAHCVFVSGVKQSHKEMPFRSGVLEYKDAYYMLSQKRVTYLQDKTMSDEYFILILFAVMKELKSRGLLVEETIPISLGVGLPPSHLPRLKNRFRDYFNRGTVKLTYNNKQYMFDIKNVTVFSQGYAAIYMDFEQISRFDKSYIIDIGGYTTDIISLNNGEIDPEFFESMDLGLIHLYNEIISEARKRYGSGPTESQIDRVIRTRQEISERMPILDIVDSKCREYVTNLYRKLSEYEIDLQFAKGIFVGGGSELLYSWLNNPEYTQQPYFIKNIHANAQGYEACLNSILR